MATKNENSTRYYSNLQEKTVASLLNANRQPNSGASKFAAGDLINNRASLMIECKTCMSDKASFSIKKEWIDKIRDEAKSKRVSNSCIAFSFGPSAKENFFIIDEKLMKFLIEKLEIDDE